MSKARGRYVKLKICKFSAFKLHQVRSVLEIITSDLLNKGDTNPIILDTGWSRSDTRFRDEFMEGTLVRLCHPHLMDKIGAPLEANNDETLHYEVINDKGEVSVLEGTGLFMPDLKFRLFYPQGHFMEL